MVTKLTRMKIIIFFANTFIYQLLTSHYEQRWTYYLQTRGRADQSLASEEELYLSRKLFWSLFRALDKKVNHLKWIRVIKCNWPVSVRCTCSTSRKNLEQMRLIILFSLHCPSLIFYCLAKFPFMLSPPPSFVWNYISSLMSLSFLDCLSSASLQLPKPFLQTQAACPAQRLRPSWIQMESLIPSQ